MSYSFPRVLFAFTDGQIVLAKKLDNSQETDFMNGRRIYYEFLLSGGIIIFLIILQLSARRSWDVSSFDFPDLQACSGLTTLCLHVMEEATWLYTSSPKARLGITSLKNFAQ